MFSELNNILDQTIGESTLANAYMNNTQNDGFNALQSLISRFQPRAAVDNTMATQLLIRPDIYMPTGTTFEQLVRWECEIVQYEMCYNDLIDGDYNMIVPERLYHIHFFGETCPFRGKVFKSWEDQRDHMYQYMKDRSVKSLMIDCSKEGIVADMQSHGKKCFRNLIIF